MPHCISGSLCAVGISFFFLQSFLVRATSIAESSPPQWPVSAVVLGAEWSFLCPSRAGGVTLFSLQGPEGRFLSRSESEWWLHSSCAECCLGAMQFPSKECCFGGFLPSFSALASHCSSSSLRNNGLVWSIHCTFLMSQMQRAHDFFFFLCHIHFALWEVLDQELRCECT